MSAWNARANEIFLQVLDREDSTEREQLLKDLCGEDLALRQSVDLLLRAHDAAGSFLERPANPISVEETNVLPSSVPEFPETLDQQTTDHDEAVKDDIDSLIAGKYKLLELIGEGGMGSVWRAKQTEPVKRFVAVKLIKAGMDSKHVMARFEAERQALALMDHPHIAKVLDGGLHQSRPFFVMELVKGAPITDYCDANQLNPHQRLELFVQACMAIQHAHQKGIIHRDIKPSNVLVALYDEKPVVKVIDFGVAKATGVALTEATIDTGFGGVIGTPQYMSPEQATFNNLDIDTRSDVYALGVLLYELLTGSPPFSIKELKEAGLHEILRVIREDEPARPSTKLSTAAALPSISANRGTDPKKLTGLLRNELDWIVMKALEKDRSRRYESANGFAMDVMRYLAGEAVLAYPPSSYYRLQKFVKRHKTQVLAGCFVFVALITGIIGTSVGMYEAKKQTALAQTNEVKANEARLEEVKQRKLVEEEKKRAIEFRDKALDALRATTGKDVELLLGEKKVLTENEKKYLGAIAKRWQTFADQEGTDAESQKIRAEGYFQIGDLWQKLGRREEARIEHSKALEIRLKLASTTNSQEIQVLIAKSYTNLGAILNDLGNRSEALTQFQNSLQIHEKLVLEQPNELAYQINFAKCCNNLALTYDSLGKKQDAEKFHFKGMEICRQLTKRDPEVEEYRVTLAYCLNNYAIHLASVEKLKEAFQYHQQAKEIQEQLVVDFPTNFIHPRDLTRSCQNIGNLLQRQEKFKEAGDHYKFSVPILENLVKEYPLVPDHQRELAINYINMGVSAFRLANGPETQRHYEKAISIQEKLVSDYPSVLEYRINLGGGYCNYAILHHACSNLDMSLNQFSKAFDLLRPVYEKDELAKQFLINTITGRAGAYETMGKYVESLKDWNQAIEYSTPAEAVRLQLYRAGALARVGQEVEALAVIQEHLKKPNLNPVEMYLIACVYARAASKIPDKKTEYVDVAIDWLKKAVSASEIRRTKARTSPDFESLKDREDFKKLIEPMPKK